jgi:sugar phosphate isomerase/epimerase
MTGFSYQLYSSRNFPPVAETFKMVAAAGYTEVEGYGGVYADLPALTDALNANGLQMGSGHFGIDMLENDVEGVFAIARASGMRDIYCPHLAPDQRPTDAAGWRAFGARLQAASAPYIAAGMGFGWHNHDFEFKALADGTLPQDAIFQGGPDLDWEADIAWIVRGGGDPLAWIKKYGPRITSVHIKDIAAPGECLDEDGWADVGHGTVDWAAIMTALRGTGCRHFVMEHDNPSDHTRFANRSIAAAKGL